MTARRSAACRDVWPTVSFRWRSRVWPVYSLIPLRTSVSNPCYETEISYNPNRQIWKAEESFAIGHG